MEKTIEGRTADTILERPAQIQLPWGRMDAPKPTLATLVLVSEEISRLEEFDSEGGKVLASLRYGRKAGRLGRVAAILLLGAKRIRDGSPSWWGRLLHRRGELDRLADRIMGEMSPSEVNELLATLLSDMQLGDFFAITTFLTGINLTKRTKVEDQTRSGER